MDTNKISPIKTSDNDSTENKRSPESLLTHIKPHFLATSSMKIKNEASEDNDIQILEEESIYRKSIAHSALLDDLSQDKPFHCTECDYRCTSRDKLKRHFMIHTGEKPYECNVCEYRCARSDKLKRHMMVHTGEKPYKCSECDFRTARNDKLKTHITKHILGKIPRKTSITFSLHQSSMHKAPLSSLNSTYSTKSVISETVPGIVESSLKISSQTKDNNLAITTTKDTKLLDSSTVNSPENKIKQQDKIHPLDKTPNELESLKSSKDPLNSSATKESVSSLNMPKDSNSQLSNARNMYTGSSSQETESQIKPPDYFYHSSTPPRDKIHYEQNFTVPPYHYGSSWTESSVPPDRITLTPINSAGEARYGMPSLPTSHLVDSSSVSQNYQHDNRILNNPMHHPAVGKVPPYMFGAYE